MMAAVKAKSQSKKEERVTLHGVRRAELGRGAMRTLRTHGFVPGVVYGKKTEAVPVSVDGHELIQILHSEAGEHALVTLAIKDVHGSKGDSAAGKWEKAVLLKDVQHHPVDGHIMHIDFHAIVLTEKVRVNVSVELKGEPVGVKERGGVLEHFLREIEVECLPTNIPHGIEFEVTEMKIGDTLHVKDLPTPEGASIITDPEGAVASVQASREEKPEEEGDAGAEPEVITEKKEEGAEAKSEEGKAEAKKDGEKKEKE